VSARCWKTLFGTISPNTQISGATRITASQLPASPNSEIIRAVAIVELADDRDVGPDQGRRQQPLRPLFEHLERQARAARALGGIVAQLHAVGTDDAELRARKESLGDQAERPSAGQSARYPFQIPFLTSGRRSRPQPRPWAAATAAGAVRPDALPVSAHSPFRGSTEIRQAFDDDARDAVVLDAVDRETSVRRVRSLRRHSPAVRRKASSKAPARVSTSSLAIPTANSRLKSSSKMLVSIKRRPSGSSLTRCWSTTSLSEGLDLAENALEQVFHGHQAGDATVLVDDQREG
jgi:hypothetical protein